MSNMKVIIEVGKDLLEIQNADTATATAAVRSFCNMLKTRQPASSKIIVEPKKVELPENPNDRKPVAAVPHQATPKSIGSPSQPNPMDFKKSDNVYHVDPPQAITVGDRPSSNVITHQELENLKHALENREEMVVINGTPGVMETIRFTNTEPPIPLYRASYDCPTCGEHGYRHVRETNNYLKCHKCEAQLAMEKTVKEADYLTSNDEGVFFYANKLAGRYNNMNRPTYQPLY